MRRIFEALSVLAVIFVSALAVVALALAAPFVVVFSSVANSLARGRRRGAWRAAPAA